MRVSPIEGIPYPVDHGAWVLWVLKMNRDHVKWHACVVDAYCPPCCLTNNTYVYIYNKRNFRIAVKCAFDKFKTAITNKSLTYNVTGYLKPYPYVLWQHQWGRGRLQTISRSLYTKYVIRDARLRSNVRLINNSLCRILSLCESEFVIHLHFVYY